MIRAFRNRIVIPAKAGINFDLVLETSDAQDKVGLRNQ